MDDLIGHPGMKIRSVAQAEQSPSSLRDALGNVSLECSEADLHLVHRRLETGRIRHGQCWSFSAWGSCWGTSLPRGRQWSGRE